MPSELCIRFDPDAMQAYCSFRLISQNFSDSLLKQPAEIGYSQKVVISFCNNYKVVTEASSEELRIQTCLTFFATFPEKKSTYLKVERKCRCHEMLKPG